MKKIVSLGILTGMVFLPILGLLLASISMHAQANSATKTLSSSPFYSPANGIIPEPGAVLTVSGWGNDSEQLIVQESLDRFTTHYPTVTVNYEPITANFQSEMIDRMEKGTAPDVFYLDTTLMDVFASNGDLEPLNGFMDLEGVQASDFITNLINLFMISDTVYALPKDQGALGLFYNVDLFATAGISVPSNTWTWADLHTAVTQLTTDTLYGLCTPAEPHRWLALVYQAGGDVLNPTQTKAVFDSPQAIEALEFWHGMYADGIGITPEELGAGWCGDAFGQEKVAMAFEGGWTIPFLSDIYPTVNYGVVELPIGPAGKGNLVFTNGWAINSQTMYPNAAALLVLYLTGEENQLAVLQTGFAIPTRIALLDDPWFHSHPNEAAILAGTKYGTVSYYGQHTDEILKWLRLALENTFAGQMAPAGALHWAASQVNCLIFQQCTEFLPVVIRN